LEGNGVEDFLSEITTFDLFQLVEDGELGGFLLGVFEEICVAEGKVQDEQGYDESFVHFF
jgi:hypothetical protein